MILKELERRAEKDLWDVWLCLYPHMTQETFISFEDFKKGNLHHKTTQITEEEIKAEMDKVIKIHEAKG